MKNLKQTLLSFFAALFFTASISAQSNGVVIYNDYNFQGANSLVYQDSFNQGL